MNVLCTICSDLVNQAESIDVTICGHVFHQHCLEKWLQRSKSCPQCRCTLTENCMFRVYFTVSNESNCENAAVLQSKLENAQLELRQERAKVKDRDGRIAILHANLQYQKTVLENYQKQVSSHEAEVKLIQDHLMYVNVQCTEIENIKYDNSVLKTNVETLHRVNVELEAEKEALHDKLYKTKKKLALERRTTRAHLENKVKQLEEKLRDGARIIEDLKEKLLNSTANIENLKEKPQSTATVETSKEKSYNNAGTVETLNEKSHDNEATVETLKEKSHDNAATVEILKDKSHDNKATVEDIEEKSHDNAATVGTLKDKSHVSDAPVKTEVLKDKSHGTATNVKFSKKNHTVEQQLSSL